MIWTSLVYITSAILILLIVIFTMLKYQFQISSQAFYYFLSMLIFLITWFIADLGLIIASNSRNSNSARIFSKLGTIFSMIAMIAVVFYTQFLTSKEFFNSPHIVISSFLLGGVIALTLSPAYDIQEAIVDPTNIFYIAKVNTLWFIFDTALPLYAGCLLIYYLTRQKKIVPEKHNSALNLMIIGTIISFFGTITIFLFRKVIFIIFDKIILLHVELLAVAIGAVIMLIATIKGGVKAFYYSSKIHSIHIYDNLGMDIYTATFETKRNVSTSFIPGVTSAISVFATDLIGKDVKPKEISFGEYSLMIETYGEINCFVCVEYPTINFRKGIQNLIKQIKINQSHQEISDMIEENLAITPIFHKNFS
ncbi:MAG: hypothetical protein ACTSXD_04475 [Candidatus Heimdallarchaeaceae archaeon]